MRRYNKEKKHRRAYKIASIPFPKGAENTHLMICGTTGTGKTSLLVDLVRQIRTRGDRAIIYDKTGGFVGRFYDADHDVIMNPLDKRSPHWSPFAESSRASDFDMMAKALIPEQKGMADPFWVQAARILFARIADSLRESGQTGNRNLVDNLLKIDLSDMAALLKNTSAQSIIDEKSPKTALSVRSVMSTYLECLENLDDDPDAPLFSIREWIKDDDRSGFMFLTSRSDLHETIRGLLSCWLEIAINTLLSLEKSPDRKVWLILDEVPSLNNIPSLQSGMAESRQFGGCFVLGLQVWSAMREIYGRDGAETLSGLARTRVVLSTPDKDTADWGSRSLGNAEQTKHRESISYGAHTMRDGVSLSVHDEIRPIALPTQIMNLPDLQAYLRLPQSFPIAEINIKPVKIAETTPLFIEKPPRPRPAPPHRPGQTGSGSAARNSSNNKGNGSKRNAGTQKEPSLFAASDLPPVVKRDGPAATEKGPTWSGEAAPPWHGQEEPPLAEDPRATIAPLETPLPPSAEGEATAHAQNPQPVAQTEGPETTSKDGEAKERFIV